MAEGGPARRVTPPKTFDSVASRYLQRAHKSLRADNWQPGSTVEAEYYFAAARVLALLDLADAVRSTRRS